jgi:hypothetical protein
MNKDSVIWCWTAVLLLWWLVSVLEGCFEKGDEGFGRIASFSDSTVENFKVDEAVGWAGCQTVDTADHSINEAGKDPRGVCGVGWQIEVKV